MHCALSEQAIAEPEDPFEAPVPLVDAERRERTPTMAEDCP